MQGITFDADNKVHLPVRFNVAIQGYFAHWIAPALRGLKSQVGDFDYVGFN